MSEPHFDEIWAPLNTIREQLENYNHKSDRDTRLKIIQREAFLILQICERAQLKDLK